MDSGKNNILARLKAAQEKRGEIGETIPDFTSPIYHSIDQSLDIEFKTNLEIIGGEVILCQSKTEVAENILRICSEKQQNRIFCSSPELRDRKSTRLNSSH